MSVRLTQRARALVAGAALSAAALGLLPGIAEAQSLGTHTIGAAHNVNASLNPAGHTGSVASSTTANESVFAPAPQPPINGALNNTTEVAAPTVPAEATATVDQSVGVGNVVNQNGCLSAGINAPAGRCAAAPPTPVPPTPVPPAPAPPAPAPPAPAPASPMVGGDVKGDVGVNAPAIPAQSTATVGGTALVDEAAGQDVCINAGVNAPAGQCAPQLAPAPAPPPPALGEIGTAEGTVEGAVEVTEPPAPVGGPIGGGANIDAATADDTLGGDAAGGVGANAPLPVQTALTVEAGAVASDLADVDTCVGLGVNQNPASCEQPTPADPPADGTQPDGTQPGDGTATPAVDGDIDSSTGIDAPAIPLESATSIDTGVVVDTAADVGGCLNVGVNQDPGVCQEAQEPQEPGPPENPEEPQDPEDPNEPEQPEESENPEEPQQLGDPEDPNNPDEPGDPNNGGTAARMVTFSDGGMTPGGDDDTSPDNGDTCSVTPGDTCSVTAPGGGSDDSGTTPGSPDGTTRGDSGDPVSAGILSSGEIASASAQVEESSSTDGDQASPAGEEHSAAPAAPAASEGLSSIADSSGEVEPAPAATPTDEERASGLVASGFPQDAAQLFPQLGEAPALLARGLHPDADGHVLLRVLLLVFGALLVGSSPELVGWWRGRTA